MTLTRRQFSWSLAGAGVVAQAQVAPIRRYLDPSTETEVWALTDPDYTCLLPLAQNRCVSSKNGFVLFAMETPQGWQAARMDIKGGALRVLTSAANLQPQSLALSADDRTVYFADGAKLMAVASNGGRLRTLYESAHENAFSQGLSLAENSTALAFRENHQAVVLPVNTSTRSNPRVVGEAEPSPEPPQLHASGAVFYRGPHGEIWYAPAGGKAIKLPIEGEIGQAVWNPDGQSILYLKLNQGKGIPNALFEYSLESGRESLVGRTSQYVRFSRNGDSSVFVGASASKAQPFVLLMLRITRRELALCEHKASNPAMVLPRFSPGSQRVFFQSDRLGKPAIFTVAVDRLVENTDADEGKANKS